MKKVLLSLAFVLAISSSAVKATNNDISELEPYFSCTEMAMELQWAYETIGFDMEMANMLADVAWTACVRNGGGI
ncbi:hypothetical protein [Polaribacter sp.]|uniref:hypothetical protein n=1 Tax=Polaribacter sp. TaxID=1920175 RepID=UPI0040477DEC